jgi:calcium/calmodulin-dependent 3',5'-cyclic nucleotide phosphodiesterase
MESGYSKYRNPYHNLVHAADVLQTTYQIIYTSGLMVEVNGVSLSILLCSFCGKNF